MRYPTASNLDEFKLLEQVADVIWVDRSEEVERADLLILPGSKHVAADLSWLARTGLAEAVSKRARAGHPVLGICGGLQMLGQRIEDGGGVDGSGEGLDLLPLRTTFTAALRAELTSARFRPLPEPWAALGGKAFSGYQIRHGRTTTTASIEEALPDGLGVRRWSGAWHLPSRPLRAAGGRRRLLRRAVLAVARRGLRSARRRRRGTPRDPCASA